MELLLNHIAISRKFVKSLIETLTKENKENIILDTEIEDIIRVVRIRNAKDFLDKLESHFNYQISTNKNLNQKPKSFNEKDFVGFEDSFEHVGYSNNFFSVTSVEEVIVFAEKIFEIKKEIKEYIEKNYCQYN